MNKIIEPTHQIKQPIVIKKDNSEKIINSNLETFPLKLKNCSLICWIGVVFFIFISLNLVKNFAYGILNIGYRTVIKSIEIDTFS